MSTVRSTRRVKVPRTPNLYKPFRFDIPGPPVGKQRTRSGYGSTKHRTPQKTRDYENHVGVMAWLASLQRDGLDDSWLSGKVYMDLRIYHKNGRKPDSDNVVKAVADGLTGIIWPNDRNVLPRVQFEIYPDNNPRVEVEINKIEEVYGNG